MVFRFICGKIVRIKLMDLFTQMLPPWHKWSDQEQMAPDHFSHSWVTSTYDKCDDGELLVMSCPQNWAS